MTALIEFHNGDIADATEVNTNFTTVQTDGVNLSKPKYIYNDYTRVTEQGGYTAQNYVSKKTVNITAGTLGYFLEIFADLKTVISSSKYSDTLGDNSWASGYLQITVTDGTLTKTFEYIVYGETVNPSYGAHHHTTESGSTKFVIPSYTDDAVNGLDFTKQLTVTLSIKGQGRGNSNEYLYITASNTNLSMLGF